MTSNTRQSNIFAAEDWKKIYTTFSDADFQSYDFETIRKVMVDYLKTMQKISMTLSKVQNMWRCWI